MNSILRIFAITAAVAIWSPVTGAFAFGDQPYLSGLADEPEVTSGCWRWNWQQHGWYDHCPRYVHPKAYMYPRARVVLRTRG